MKVRIETQAYVLVDGDRKMLEFTGPDGVAREVRVDVDLIVCRICSAALVDGPAANAHIAWHQGQRP